jgi:predicted small lipoprotein YifL
VKAMLVVFAVLSSAACGVIGSPIPPEEVGVAPVIERQQRLDALEAAKKEAVESQPVAEPQGQDVELPDLRPVGTR